MRWIALLLVGLLSALPAAAQTQWAVAFGPPSASEGPKFGYVLEGDALFSTLFAYYLEGTRKVVVLADVGEHPPNDRESSFTLAVNGEPPITVSGIAEPSLMDGRYWLKAALDLEHPLFKLLSKGQPMTYIAGSTRVSLSASNLTATLLRWRNACR